MKTPVNLVENFYFPEEVLAELDKNILTVSKEYIDRLIKQIHTDAEENTLEIAILRELLLYIKEKREYYQNKEHEYYNFVSFKWATLFSMALLILVGLLYCPYKYYHLPKKMEMLALIEELKPYGVTIKECSKRVYRSTEYWLETDDTEFMAKMHALNEQLPNGQLSAEEYDRIRNMINTMDGMTNRIHEIHSTLRGKLKWIAIIVGSVAFYAIERIYFYIKQWYKPQYKERYEKFSWLETKVQKRILYVQKKSIAYDELVIDDENS